MLVVLMVVWAFNGVDGFALGLVMQNIKTDLHLSDTQLGLLTGIAFALFYSIMGIPIARWADRGNRVTLLAFTATIWSVLVALCGTAVNFLQLLLLRVGVGIGEAGCMPTSQSLIGDYFNRAERPRATAMFTLGDALGMFIGLFVAGWVNEFCGWRIMFMLLGLPGVVLAALVGFTFREPRFAKSTRTAIHPLTSVAAPAVRGSEAGPPRRPTLKEISVILWANRTFRHLLFYFAVGNFFFFGVLQWQPAFLIRSYGLQSGELGTWLAAINVFTILVGRYGGGELASRFAGNNERLQLRVVAIAYALSGISSTFIYLATNLFWALLLMAVSGLLANLSAGPLYALVQTLVPERMRATSMALLLFSSSLIGNGFGPLLTGALSDALRPQFGEESLRFALLGLCPGLVWAAWHLWQASVTVMGDLQWQDEHIGMAESRDVTLRASQVSVRAEVRE
jgi:MFS family permease